MSKASKYLLVTEVNAVKESFNDCLAKWTDFSKGEQSRLYTNRSEEAIIELRAFSDLTTLNELLVSSRYERLRKNLTPFLKSDLRQEVLEYKEDVVSQKELLPTSKYLQMRHIEVPLNVYSDYLSWREETIFNHVKKLETVDSFTAYHSILSTAPGVMFVSSFSCDPDQYLAGFMNDAYQEIVRQAGDRYIAGGVGGLYTKLYEAV